jgi:hypothetical protein
MHDLAVWRLAALEREREALIEDHRAMLAAMEGDMMAYGGFAAAGVRRIRSLEVKIAAADAARAAQSKRALDLGTRAKLVERALGGVAAQYREQKERKELAELIDASLRNPKSSPA